MTANRNLKRLVRARARETGESYTAALWHFKQASSGGRQDPCAAGLRRVEKPAYGFTLHVPDNWREAPPDLRNSPWEVARFAGPGAGAPSCIVVRNPSVPGLGARAAAQDPRHLLEAAGYQNFRLAHVRIGGQPGARLEYDGPASGGVCAVRHYFVVADAATFGVRLASSAPAQDARLLDAVVEGFEFMGDLGRAAPPQPTGREPGVFEKPEYGFALRLPESWVERPANVVGNPWEVARFTERGDARHVCLVSRRPRVGGTAGGVAEEVQGSLAATGFGDFALSDVVLAGEPAVLVSCSLSDAGRIWAVHNYHLVVSGVGFTLHFGTAIPEQDAPLLEAVAAGFRLLAPAGTALTRRGTAPPDPRAGPDDAGGGADRTRGARRHERPGRRPEGQR